MRIAVLMSTYNGEAYLEEQLNSILNQCCVYEIDIFVRDDGSEDGTKLLLEQYKKKFKIKFVSGVNLKPAKSFLELLYICGNYDFYCFSDQDDYWEPNKVQIGIEMLSQCESPALYCSNAELVDENLVSFGKKVYRNPPIYDLYSIFCTPNVLGCTVIMNDALIKIFRSAERPIAVTMHDSYLARVCLSCGGRILYDHKPHMKYRQHSDNVIGIKHDRFGIIKQRIGMIFSKSPITIDLQAKQIKKLYEHYISEENMKCIEQISNYRYSFYNRLKLATSNKPHYVTRNMSIAIRLSILFGNR